MESEVVKFYADDGVELNGYIVKSGVESKKVLIEIHGMTSNCFRKRESIISEKVQEIGVDSICFNTRGSEIVKYIKYGNGSKALAGTAYENIEESYHDILGAIKYAVNLGYNKIYLQGHSLGSTKTVYVYNKMKEENNEYLKYVKGIILLSLVDIPSLFKFVSNSKFLEYALKKEQENSLLEMMPAESFVHPISVKNYLKYVKYNSDIDFAKYNDSKYDYKELNAIEVPLFMRWGNNREFIQQKAENLVSLLDKKIINKEKDISFINGSNHSYDGKEEVLAKGICNFLIKIWVRGD